MDLKASLGRQKTLLRKAAKLDIAKMAMSQGLAYAPKLCDMATSKIKNKNIQKLLQSEMAKSL